MDLRDWLTRCPIVAILRGITPEEAEPVCAALDEAGIRIVEVPMNSPEALRSVAAMAAKFGDRLLLGAGTLTEESQVQQVADAGGRLIVTPHANVSIVRAAKAAGIFAAPGFFNPTEAFSLLAAGADAIKLFPAEVVGTAMLKAMLAVLPPSASVIPVGGIDAASLPAWMAAGAAGVGAGSSIYKPGDIPETVFAKATALLDALHPA